MVVPPLSLLSPLSCSSILATVTHTHTVAKEGKVCAGGGGEDEPGREGEFSLCENNEEKQLRVRYRSVCVCVGEEREGHCCCCLLHLRSQNGTEGYYQIIIILLSHKLGYPLRNT